MQLALCFHEFCIGEWKIFHIYICPEGVQTVLLVTVPGTMHTEAICMAPTLC